MLREEKRKILIELMKKMKEDNSLPLKPGTTHLVFGEGNVDTEILFIGEGPGYWEDLKGRPFVGNAGGLLNQLLGSIGLQREDVFITNVVHHRPPQNRDPLPHEIAAYQPYLDTIIQTIEPKVIVTLGRFSMGKFLPGVLISQVHGKPKDILWNGKEITVIPMYHPAAALRNGNVKQQLTADFKVILDVLNKKKVFMDEIKDEAEIKGEQGSLL